jgi:hypothetical protein
LSACGERRVAGEDFLDFRELQHLQAFIVQNSHLLSYDLSKVYHIEEAGARHAVTIPRGPHDTCMQRNSKLEMIGMVQRLRQRLFADVGSTERIYLSALLSFYMLKSL